VTDLATSEILQGKISLFDNKFNPIGTVNTDDKKLYFSVECGKTYNVRAEKPILPRKKGDYCRRRRKNKLDIALEKRNVRLPSAMI
jgi:hypothetical protein